MNSNDDTDDHDNGEDDDDDKYDEVDDEFLFVATAVSSTVSKGQLPNLNTGPCLPQQTRVLEPMDGQSDPACQLRSLEYHRTTVTQRVRIDMVASGCNLHKYQTPSQQRH